MYGALKYAAISNVVPVEEIEQYITDACQDSCSLTPYPEAPSGVPTILYEENNSVIAQWLIEWINIDIDLLTTKIMTMTEQRDELYKTLNDIEVSLKERHKVILVRQHGIRTQINAHILFQDIKATYEAAAARQINPTRRGAPPGPDEVIPEDVIGAFYLYVKHIKAMMEADISQSSDTPEATTSTPHIIPTPPTADATSSPNTAEGTPAVTPTSENHVADLTSSTTVRLDDIANPSPTFETSANLPVVESPFKVPNLLASRLQQTH